MGDVAPRLDSENGGNNMKNCFRWTGSFVALVGSLISLLHFGSIAYEYLGLAQILQRKGSPSTLVDGFTLLMCILMLVSMYILLWSIPRFLRETWKGIQRIVRLIKLIKRRARKHQLERLPEIILKTKMLRRLEEVHKWSPNDRLEIRDSLTGLSLEDLRDLIPTVWRGLV